MDSSKIIRIIIGIITIFYSFLGVWYFSELLDYYGLFIAVGLLILGVLMTFSAILQKTSRAHPDDEPRVDFDEWLIIAWAGAAALGLYYLISPVQLSILYTAVFFLYYAVTSTSHYMFERWRIIKKRRSSKANQKKLEKQRRKEEKKRLKDTENKRKQEEKRKEKMENNKKKEENKVSSTEEPSIISRS